MTYLTALTVSNWTWDAPRVYGLEKGIEGSINPLADYGLAMERAGEDVSQHNGASTHFHQNESLTSPSNDLAIKSINNQTTSDIFDFQQLWQSHYQLKPVPNSQESQFQGVKLYSELRAIKPKPDSSPQNLEQRSRYRRVGRWETSKVRSASRKMRQFRCCNCQMKDPVSG
jgi:hypothetical protein